MKNIFLASLFYAIFISTESSIKETLDGGMKITWKEMQTEKQLQDEMQRVLEHIVDSIISVPVNSTLQTQGPDHFKLIGFLQQLFYLLCNLEEYEIETVSRTIEKDIEKRYDSNKSFRKLLEIPVVRRSMNVALQTLRDAHTRKCFNIRTMYNPQNEFKKDEDRIIDRVESDKTNAIYNFFIKKRIPLLKNYVKVIQYLNSYLKLKLKHLDQNINQNTISVVDSKKNKRFDIDSALQNFWLLETITKNPMNNLFFDENKDITSKQRDYIKELLHSFWNVPNKITHLEFKTKNKRIKRTNKELSIPKQSLRKKAKKSSHKISKKNKNQKHKKQRHNKKIGKTIRVILPTKERRFKKIFKPSNIKDSMLIRVITTITPRTTFATTPQIVTVSALPSTSHNTLPSSSLSTPYSSSLSTSYSSTTYECGSSLRSVSHSETSTVSQTVSTALMKPTTDEYKLHKMKTQIKKSQEGEESQSVEDDSEQDDYEPTTEPYSEIVLEQTQNHISTVTANIKNYSDY